MRKNGCIKTKDPSACTSAAQDSLFLQTQRLLQKWACSLPNGLTRTRSVLQLRSPSTERVGVAPSSIVQDAGDSLSPNKPFPVVQGNQPGIWR